jgi:hypothetical protein
MDALALLGRQRLDLRLGGDPLLAQPLRDDRLRRPALGARGVLELRDVGDDRLALDLALGVLDVDVRLMLGLRERCVGTTDRPEHRRVRFGLLDLHADRATSGRHLPESRAAERAGREDPLLHLRLGLLCEPLEVPADMDPEVVGGLDVR